jgi:peptidoglycan/xylan/chitin deacetylase (PgdA/CDA1 family)
MKQSEASCAEGHLIYNHSYSIMFYLICFRQWMLEDMQRMDQETYKVLGFRPKFFRPPYGVTNPNLAKAIEQGGILPWDDSPFNGYGHPERKKLLARIS